MASSINKVILIGNLGKDPEMRQTQAGKAVASFSIACTDSWKDKNGDKQERTEWVNISCFDKLAEICGKYLKKGSQVYVEGRLQTDKYQKNGVDHYSTKVLINDMKMLGKKEGGSNNAPAPAAPDESDTPF